MPSEPRTQYWAHAFYGGDENKDGEEEGGEEDKPAPADHSPISSFNASLGRGVLEEVTAGLTASDDVDAAAVAETQDAASAGEGSSPAA